MRDSGLVHWLKPRVIGDTKTKYKVGMLQYLEAFVSTIARCVETTRRTAIVTAGINIILWCG